MELPPLPPGVLVDADRVEAWVEMNAIDVAGTRMVYVDDLLMGLRGGFTTPG